jgi:hypothetical protein
MKIIYLLLTVLTVLMSACSPVTTSSPSVAEEVSSEVKGSQLHVSVENAAADDANPGTAEAPLKTLAAALALLEPGKTILLHPGVYREKVELTVSGTEEAPITIRAVEPGTAVISGADPVTDWEDRGEGLFAKALPDLEAGWDNQFIRSQWLFKNGEPLRRWELSNLESEAKSDKNRPPFNYPHTVVDRPEDLDVGTFTIDLESKTLYVMLEAGESAEESDWKISRRQGLMQAPEPIDYIHIDGLVFSHNAGWWRGESSLEIKGRNWVVENCVFRWSSNNGVHVERANGLVFRNNRIEWSGKLGIGASQVLDMLFEGNTIRFSNWMPHDQNWEAGSTKFTTTLDSTFRNNDFQYALGGGMWFDVYNSDNLIENNRVVDHVNGAGLFSEISWHDVYRGNLSMRNHYGVAIGQSNGAFVENNVVVDNRTGLQVWGGFRRPSFRYRQDYMVKYRDRVAAIPGISDRRVAMFDAAMRRYFGYTDKLPQMFATFESNLVFDNHWNVTEDRNYAEQKTGDIAVWDNSFSERNTYWSDDEALSFMANFQKYSYGSFEAWKEATGRDSTSQWTDPRLESFEAPVWAERYAEDWSAEGLNPMQLYRQHAVEPWDSAMSAVMKSRMMQSASIRKVFGDPGRLQAYVFDHQGERVLVLFQGWKDAKGKSVVVSIDPDAEDVVRESGYLNRTELPPGPVTERIGFVPVYFRGVGDGVSVSVL